MVQQPLDKWLWRAHDSLRGIRLMVAPGYTERVLKRLLNLQKKEIEAGFDELRSLRIRRSPLSPIDIWIEKTDAKGQTTREADSEDSPDPLLPGS